MTRNSIIWALWEINKAQLAGHNRAGSTPAQIETAEKTSKELWALIRKLEKGE